MNRGDATTLFILAMLERHGQKHGHWLRREAKTEQAELWADVKVGSIYAGLRKLEANGLVQAGKSERPGSYPERTLYHITEEGKRELIILRRQLLQSVVVVKDPFDLAFSFAGPLPAGELEGVLTSRIATISAIVASLEQRRLSARQYLDDIDELLIEHLLMRLNTELTWHGQVLKKLPGLNSKGG